MKHRDVARAIIFLNNCVLLAKGTNNDNYFLPGGGIEGNELPDQALEREINEELGCKVVIGELLCDHSNSFLIHGGLVNERIYVYSASILLNQNKLDPIQTDLEFCWIPIERITEVLLLPISHMELIQKFRDQEQNK